MLEYGSDSLLYRDRGLMLSEMLEHHRSRPDLSDGIGNSLSRNVGSRTVHRLKHRRILTLRIEICGRGNANRTYDGGTQVREDVTEQIRSDNDVEPVWMPHEVRGQDVDVVLVRPNVRKFICYGSETFIPKGHGM